MRDTRFISRDRDETSIEEESLLIDCDLCEYSGSETCNDCLITYLCRPDGTQSYRIIGHPCS
ncbi:MAG: hypothetical protein Ct9H300mP26_4740 [Acidimicrobiales bacterium]|nr:MAG: hypothetical protein Ct9H300mP26_4740 [Acidimicrobiales bacterium]